MNLYLFYMIHYDVWIFKRFIYLFVNSLTVCLENNNSLWWNFSYIHIYVYFYKYLQILFLRYICTMKRKFSIDINSFRKYFWVNDFLLMIFFLLRKTWIFNGFIDIKRASFKNNNHLSIRKYPQVSQFNVTRHDSYNAKFNKTIQPIKRLLIVLLCHLVVVHSYVMY